VVLQLWNWEGNNNVSPKKERACCKLLKRIFETDKFFKRIYRTKIDM
jgi:hypothetical protein